MVSNKSSFFTDGVVTYDFTVKFGRLDSLTRSFTVGQALYCNFVIPERRVKVR